MDTFDIIENGIAPGSKISRAAWEGNFWVDAPVDRSSALAFGNTPLQTAYGPIPWPDAPWDMAQPDWLVLP